MKTPAAELINKLEQVILIPVLLRNRLISARLEPVLSYTEKSCITLHYKQLSTNNKIKLLKLLSVLLDRAFGP